MRRLRPIGLLSPKTRAILFAIKDVDLPASMIATVTGIAQQEVHSRIQNCVISGYAVITEQQIVGGHLRNTYRASEAAMLHEDKVSEFAPVQGYDCRALIEAIGPKRGSLPNGTKRIVQGVMSSSMHEGEDETA